MPATAPAALALPSLDTQLERLLELDLPGRAGRTAGDLRSAVEPLRTGELEDGATLLVVTSAWAGPEVTMPLVAWRGKAGRVEMTPNRPSDFLPIDQVVVPGEVYLVRGIDTGRGYGGRPPEQVLPEVLGAGRTPLTIDEGVALLLQQPGILKEHNAFSLAGSRAGNRRVPALWTSRGAPRLGWCWDGAVHDWLGLASCASRTA